MSLDSISETIAHFIGTFELTSEQVRLRDQYQEFTALRRKAELDQLEDPISVRVKTDLKLDPGRYEALPFKAASEQAALSMPVPPSVVVPVPVIILGPLSGEGGATPESQLMAPGFPIVVEEPVLEPELLGSAVTYTFQTHNLNDNDTIGQGDFRDTETQIVEGQEMLEVATQFHAVGSPSIEISDYQSVETLKKIVAQAKSADQIEIDGATVYTFEGESAAGAIVNGEHVDEIPDWVELLPQHHQPEVAAQDETQDQPDPLPAEWNQQEEDEFGEGHTVIAGGNLAINEVAVTVGWVDAPVIAVGGYAVDLTVVSQVSVVSDVDEGAPGTQSHTNVVQASYIDTQANEAAWLDDNVAAPGQNPLVAISWITSDLYVTNFVQQVINATDIDHIETELTAATSLYTLGDNEIVNVTDIVQLGSYYDIVIIGGNMISVDMVHQTVVLMDDDVIHGASVHETNDNLVVNQVALTDTGQDTHEDLTETFAGVLPLQEMDTEALEDALLNDPEFAGMEQIRVLKIDGDLVQVNVVEQVTLLQDQDDVLLSGADATVMGAGNAVLNTASISNIGVNSVVMAGEGEYSDVVLHQASLFDTPAETEGAEIATEAVALLIEETSAVADAAIAQAQTGLTPSEMADADDGLHAMLA